MQTSKFSFSINREHFGRTAIYFKRHSILVDESSVNVKDGVVRMPSKCFDNARKVWFEDTIHVSNKAFIKALYWPREWYLQNYEFISVLQLQEDFERGFFDAALQRCNPHTIATTGSISKRGVLSNLGQFCV